MDATAAIRTPVGGRFFRKIDWFAFWTATLVSFGVYFFTLGPSVTLEDAGELAVAGDYLGVPHPPGYPIWTMGAWVFARVFSWVTFRGQPTPAWSIALFSAFCGALAAGFTAMLITRSSSDMLRDTRATLHRAHGRREDWLCWAGGVAGSLIFAFSPVMWSQATIVEVYALNAFFLMLIMLLTYRWMRQPSDKLLWLTAFVFGLGLTNYQVLLLAALPLVVVILLREFAMFRDFMLVVIPFGLTALALKLGAMAPTAGFVKSAPLAGTMLLPSLPLALTGLAIFGLALLWTVVRGERQRRAARETGGMDVVGIVGFALGILLVLFSLVAAKEGLPASDLDAPLAAPPKYILAGVIVLAAVALCVLGATHRGPSWSDPWAWAPLLGVGVLLLFLAGLLSSLPAAGGCGAPFPWGSVLGMVTLVLLVLLAVGWFTPRGIYFAAAVVVIEIALFGLLRKGVLLGLTHPATWWFWAPLMLNFVILALAWILLPHGRTVALTVLMAELGVAFYAYMPIVSDRNPPMNWGYPRTWEGFKHALMRGQYEKIAPSFSPLLVKQIGSYFTDMRTQFTMLLAPLGFLPFAAWQFRRHGRGFAWGLPAAAGALLLAVICWGLGGWLVGRGGAPVMGVVALAGGLRHLAVLMLVTALALALLGGMRPLHVALGCFVVSGVFVVLGNVAVVERAFDVARIDKLLVGGILILAFLGGLLITLTQFDELAVRVWQEGKPANRILLAVCSAALLLALGYVFNMGFQAHFPPAVTRLLAFGMVVLLAILLVMSALLRRRLAETGELRCALDGVAQQWIIATVAAFLVMSVLLIVLANPKGDLQDAFIQKVKFISSHGLFAIWIGYGIVFALASCDTLLERIAAWLKHRDAPPPLSPAPDSGWTHVAMLLAVVLALALPLIPIHQNYTNERLVFELGATEQNGHDFGWQFGNYQLRGAAAIAEELDADEEPLPNPAFPPAMGTNAVFFGGTDPGRFVPTYMIYSAHVREDVFLITQNALADNTYMSVMRDLYGDRIWIPTPDDSAQAFQIYVEEVQSGKRPRNAELVIDNGRVQVSGALGVMEINGILCDMIFKHNIARHAFYVEESYVIPWMFPFLAPHGLIMEIEATPRPLTPERVRDDLDFWDWYARRLTCNPRFRRDIVAQKSFSKLRSAIGGLYASRGMLREAERAFFEARMLYPVSPEANFRLIQEVLMSRRRYDEALVLLNDFIASDPNNDRGAGFRDFIGNIRDKEQRIRELVAQVPPGQPPSITTALEIAACYYELGSPEMVSRVLSPLLDDPRLSARSAFEIAKQLDAARDHAGAVRAMDFVMARMPANASPELLLSAARVYANAQDPKRMIDPLTRYLRLRPNDWNAWIDLATLHDLENDAARAQAALRRAIELGRQEAIKAIEASPRLRQLALPVVQQIMGGASGGLGL